MKFANKAEAATEVKRLRKEAKRTDIPQAAKNQMLDKANMIEAEMYTKETGKPYAKGGAAMKKAPAKKMAKGGSVKKGKK